MKPGEFDVLVQRAEERMEDKDYRAIKAMAGTINFLSQLVEKTISL